MSGFDSPTNASHLAPRVEELFVVAAVIVAGDRFLAARRLPGGAAGEKWEFPGGKVEPGETPEAALQREIDEELGLHIHVDGQLGTFRAIQGERRIALQCHWCSLLGGELKLSAHSEVKWLLATELLAHDWATPDIPAVEQILDRIASAGIAR